MPIALDASTPSFSTVLGGANFGSSATSGTITLTSASFSPPAGSLVVVGAVGSYLSNVSYPLGLTCADSGSASYSLALSQPSSTGTLSYCGLAFFENYYSGAPGPVTVTVTLGSAEVDPGGTAVDLYVWVLTGCAPSQAGAATGTRYRTAGTSRAETCPVTTTTAGSWVLLLGADGSGLNATAASGCTVSNQLAVDSSDNSVHLGKVTAATGTPGAVTAGFTSGSTVTNSGGALQLLALEVLPASGGTSVSGSDTGTGADGGEQVTVLDADTPDETGTGADFGAVISLSDTDGAQGDDAGAVTASLRSADAGGAADGGESSLHGDFSQPVAARSQTWLTRWGRQRFPRSLPVPQALSFTGADAATGADGAEFVSVSGQLSGPSTVQLPPSYRAAYRHAARPALPVFMPAAAMTVTVSISDVDFTLFQGGSLLQVYVLDGATQFGGASDGEAIANLAATGTVTPAFTGSFVGWAAFNDTSGAVSASIPAAGNVLDTGIPGTTSPVGATGHVTAAVTAGVPLGYGLANGQPGDAFVLAACEVPPLVPGVPVTLDGATAPGVTDTGSATSLTSQSFTPPAGTVLVAVYAANNSGSAEHCTFAIADSRGLAWTQTAVQNSGGSFLVVIWTATVPTLALADTDAAGPASDFVGASTWAGQFRWPDAGTGTDTGQVTAAVPEADASGAAAESAFVTAVPASPGTGTGTDAGEGIAVTAASPDTATGTDGTGSVDVVTADIGRRGTDGGEQVAAAVPSSDPATGSDGGEAIAVTAASPDTGTGADAGEGVLAEDFTILRLPVSPSFRARFRHKGRPQVVPATVNLFRVSDPVPDTGLGFDAEISNPFPVDTPETCLGADGAEAVHQSDADAGTATDTAFEFESCRGTERELTAWPGDADSSVAFDQDAANAFPAAGSDASGAAADGDGLVAKNVPKSGSDASGAAADAGEHVTAAVPSSDVSTSVDDRELIPEDRDSATGADGGEGILSGTFADSDSSLAFDVESRVFGPNNQVSDSDASGAAADGGELPDVYAYVPLSRWTGSQFDVRRRPPEG